MALMMGVGVCGVSQAILSLVLLSVNGLVHELGCIEQCE